MVVHVLNRSIIDVTKLGTIVGDCRQIISSNPNLEVRFVPRQANHAARHLVRAIVFTANPSNLLCSLLCIGPLIISEMI